MTDSERDRGEVLFLLGWPRCGLACLHRFFRRAMAGWDHFYQPFHPRLAEILDLFEEHPENLRASWDEPVDGMAPRDQFSPYIERADAIRDTFDPAFGGSRFYAEDPSRQEKLGEYLRELTRDAPGTVLSLARGSGRVALWKKFFPRARFVLLVRDPLALWMSWHDHPTDPTAERLPVSVHGVDRRFQELEARLPDEPWRQWGFEWARDRSPFEKFLLVWGVTHRLALGQIAEEDRSATVRWEDVCDDPDAVRGWICDRLNLRGAGDARPEPGSGDPPRRVDPAVSEAVYSRLNDLPASSPVPDLLDRLGYPHRGDRAAERGGER